MSRISYRNYKPLIYLKKGFDDYIPCFSEDKIELLQKSEKINFEFQIHKEMFKTSILNVSRSFINSSMSCIDKLWNMVDLDRKKEEYITEQGTMIFNDSVFFYYIAITDDDVCYRVFEFYKDGSLVNFVSGEQNGIFNFNSKKENHAYSFFKTNYAKSIYEIIITILYFKKYASVEVIESKSKTKTHQFGCKYLNETDLDIEYLDSKWFTSIVSSNGFKVRGFFRLQPKKKDGEWTKELIWIDEFEKQGYNRKAKILNN